MSQRWAVYPDIFGSNGKPIDADSVDVSPYGVLTFTNVQNTGSKIIIPPNAYGYCVGPASTSTTPPGTEAATS